MIQANVANSQWEDMEKPSRRLVVYTRTPLHLKAFGTILCKDTSFLKQKVVNGSCETPELALSVSFERFLPSKRLCSV